MKDQRGVLLLKGDHQERNWYSDRKVWYWLWMKKIIQDRESRRQAIACQLYLLMISKAGALLTAAVSQLTSRMILRYTQWRRGFPSPAISSPVSINLIWIYNTMKMRLMKSTKEKYKRESKSINWEQLIIIPNHSPIAIIDSHLFIRPRINCLSLHSRGKTLRKKYQYSKKWLR